MKFVYNDGGREAAGFKGSAGDCVTRSVAIASGLPYKEVYARMAEGTGNQRATSRTPKRGKSARNGINVRRKWFRDYMAELGFVWTPTMFVGQGCTTHLHDGELPNGRLVVSVSKHYTAVIDGVVHDLFDPQRDAHVVDFNTNRPLKRGEWLHELGDRICKISRRCVYGYWEYKGD